MNKVEKKCFGLELIMGWNWIIIKGKFKWIRIIYFKDIINMCNVGKD